ncbi:hypothetical protein ANN_21447 [Periplaneta americana]|uniref:Uncharacterized protein n=1 Tax=Periplaneta americana TaxID=6978 RepID=A0ABQ8SFB7_PERAM|nr:hypothetical protein ANN_21447 [Periplaneta americana]
MLAHAFIPSEYVSEVFEELGEHASDEMLPGLDYFNRNYIIAAQDRRCAVPPHYPPIIVKLVSGNLT